jgi:CRP-like cAMP-binding protein
MTEGERAGLAPRLRFAPFVKGEIITRQGAEAHWLYILHVGKVQVRIERDGHAKAVAELEAPSFFGEHGLMTGAPRSATIVALTDVECYRLDKDGFKNTLEQRPEIARDLSLVLAQRQRGLLAAREDLDSEAKAAMAANDSEQILKRIQRFFGLNEGG